MRSYYYLVIITLLPLISFPKESFSQKADAGFLVYFTDKNDAPFTTNNPKQFLSERAINRRAKLNIAITTQDLPVTPHYVDTLVNRGFDVSAPSKWLNAVYLKLADSAEVMSMLSLPFVDTVELVYYDNFSGGNKSSQKPNYTVSGPIAEFSLGEFDKGSSPYSLNYGGGFTQANMLGATFLHQLGYTGKDMVIALLDGGFAFADTMEIFDSLRSQNRILSTYNPARPGKSVYGASAHGTYVLSTMGGNIPGDLVGTAPHASYHLIVTEDVAYEFPVEEFFWTLGAEYADSVGADLINSSLGYSTFDHPMFNYSFSANDGETSICARAANIASQKGILVVSSAGNGGGSPWFYVSHPADAKNIITVGAIDISGNYAPFSSTGYTADRRVKPDAVAVGWNATIADLSGGTGTGNGTSFSSPILCGALACLRQAFDTIPIPSLIDAVQRSGHQWANPDSLLGYGIPNLAVAHLILGGQKIPDIEEKEIKISPNPFYDHLVVSFNTTDTQNITLELYDIRGAIIYSSKIIAQTGINAITVPELSKLTAGVYLVKITDNKNTITRKVIRK